MNEQSLVKLKEDVEFYAQFSTDEKICPIFKHFIIYLGERKKLAEAILAEPDDEKRNDLINYIPVYNDSIRQLLRL